MLATISVQTLLSALNDHGVLLEADQDIPSVVSLVAGEPIRGSWWGHPLGHLIYDLSCRLYDHPDVLCTKLVGGKVTYVHRRLWPAILAVGSDREAWQLEGLSPAAEGILDEVVGRGTLRYDHIALPGGKSPSGAVKELETRLLARSYQIHSEFGNHVRVLESWDCWAAGNHLQGGTLSAAEGKALLEEAFASLRGNQATRLKLPWDEMRRPRDESASKE